jgi:hypothetical protein
MHRLSNSRVGAERKMPHLPSAQVGGRGSPVGPCSVHGSLPSCASMSCRSLIDRSGYAAIESAMPHRASPALGSIGRYLGRDRI